MADAPKVLVGAGVNNAGDAAITLEFGCAAVVLDIYAAMKFADLVERKIGEAINWHKLAHDPDPDPLLKMAAHGTA